MGIETAVIVAAVISGVVSAAVGFGLSAAFGPDKPKIPNLDGFSGDAVGATKTIRNPTNEQRLLYGHGAFGGVVAYAHADPGSEFLHLVIVYAANEITAHDVVWLADRPIYREQIDANGDVTDGFYAGTARIRKLLGTDAQTALTDIPGGWTQDHRLRGHAYLHVRLRKDRDKFPLGIPNIRSEMRGKKVFDPRDTTTKYTNNAALVIRDWLLTPIDRGGIGVPASRIDDTAFIAAANVCDEFQDVSQIAHTVTVTDTDRDRFTVSGEFKLIDGDRVQVTTTGTVPGGLALATNYFVTDARPDDKTCQLASTYQNALDRVALDVTSEGTGTHSINKNAEPRYTADGIVALDRRAREILEDFVSALAGRAIYTGGAWSAEAGAWVAPTITLDENDIHGPIKTTTKISRRDRGNAVKGVYVSPLNDFQPSDYPAVTNTTYETQDQGERKFIEFDLPFTARPHMAQRIAKVQLEQKRREINVELRCGLVAVKLKVGDTFALDYARAGWSGKSFRVIDWKLVRGNAGEDDIPKWFVDIKAREVDAGVFNWTTLDEATFNPRLSSTLPDPFTVFQPTAIRLSTENVRDDQGNQVATVRVRWAAPEDAFVTQGGTIEIQFRRTGETEWQPSFFVDGALVTATFGPVGFGDFYDIRLRSVNRLGVRASSWQVLSNFEVGTSFGTFSASNWGNLEAAGSFGSFGATVAVPAGTQKDWGPIA